MFYKGKRDRSAETRPRPTSAKAPTLNIIDLIRKLNENHKEFAKKTLKANYDPIKNSDQIVCLVKKRVRSKQLQQSLQFAVGLHRVVH